MREVLPIARRGRSVALRATATMPIATRLAVAGVVGGAIFSVLLLRLWALTVLSGSQYEQLAHQNQIRRVPSEAPRGAIVDRTGRPLVTNRPSRQVVLFLQDAKKLEPAQREQLYRRLARTLDVPLRDIKRRVKRGSANPLSAVVLADDVQDEHVLFYIDEHEQSFPGVDTGDAFVRNYVAGSVAAHIAGQVGEVSPEQLKGEFANLKPGDRVGQAGLEYTYDRYLRGVDGYDALEVDAAGVIDKRARGVPATPGNNLRLSLDLPLQQATERALVEGITIAHRSAAGARANAGAAVAIDPRNGELLALASYPTYDPGIFVTPGHDKRITKVLEDRRTPLTNRAISGLYPPGSTFKVVTALAAMQWGFVDDDDLISCPSSMKIAGTKFRNWTDESLGAMDMRRAIEVSCDTYFYTLALDFYRGSETRLQDYARRFGLGGETGIDLPGEAEGVVPDRSWRRKTFEGFDRTWSPGHSVNLSIGQGDLLVTPLQMTSMYAAIANGGTLHTPRLAHSVEEPSGKTRLTIASPEPRVAVGRGRRAQAQLQVVRDGLYRAANGSWGTSSAVFGSFELPVSGKTGTAEKPPSGDMAWYCGYAPAQSPTIAVCAIIEGGGHGGTSAAPVVLRMFQQWFGASGGSVATGKRSD